MFLLMADVRWLDEREARAWRDLQMMHMRLDAELARDLAKHSDLSYQDYVVLVALTERPDGEMRLYELAQVLGWEASRLSHHVSRMVARGLVTKFKCESDRRGAVVGVSGHGREQITAAAPSHVDAVRRMFLDVVDPSHLEVIAEVSGIVLRHLSESVAEQPFPDCPDDGVVDEGSSALADLPQAFTG
jgi:DNA-binding MarR family transcriptional regulator